MTSQSKITRTKVGRELLQTRLLKQTASNSNSHRQSQPFSQERKKKKKKSPLLYFSFLFVLSAPLLKSLIPLGFSDFNYFLYPSDPCHLISSSLSENFTFISQSL